MKQNKYKILKLRSGENIICSITKDMNGKFLIEQPFDMETMIMVDKFGMPRHEKLILKNWMNYSKDKRVTIPKDYIVDIINPSDAVLEYYLIIRKTGGIVKMTPEEEQRMADEMRGNYDAIKDMIKDYMSTDIPQELLNSMQDEWFVEDVIEDEVVEDEHPSPPEDDYGPYGCNLDDWSPDPNDYI
jgi:hypothetical protein